MLPCMHINILNSAIYMIHTEFISAGLPFSEKKCFGLQRHVIKVQILFYKTRWLIIKKNVVR